VFEYLHKMRSLLTALLLIAVPAFAADRPTDREIKQLIDRLYEERDRFEGNLDGALKRTTFKGPQGEVNVERVLDDLQENVGTFRDRFKPDYSASTEAGAVMRQATGIHRYLSSQPPTLKGQSEWNRVVTTLGEIAAAYGTTFPLPDGAAPRRYNDPEVKKAAELVGAGADRLKSVLDTALKADKTIDKPTREAALKDVESLKNAAKTLASRIGDSQPASADAKALLDRMAAAQTAAARSSAPAVQTAVGGMRASATTIAQAFGISAP
jgi:hypothetical protein